VILELDERQAAFQRDMAAFAAETVAPRAQGIDDSNQFPRDIVVAMAGRGLLGVTIPREWGGAGLDYVSYALALEAVAHASAVVSVIASVNNSLVAEPLARFGSDSQ
jgi:alkylation response protein AidB-like acyl-CoA dehydrogenase